MRCAVCKAQFMRFYFRTVNDLLQIGITGGVPDHNLKLPRFDAKFHIDVVKGKELWREVETDIPGLAGLESDALEALEFFDRTSAGAIAIANVHLNHVVAQALTRVCDVNLDMRRIFGANIFAIQSKIRKRKRGVTETVAERRSEEQKSELQPH